MDKKVFVIAIDGPVASGKGTISTKLARELKGFYLSSGAMYRAFGLHCLENKIDITAEEAIVKALIGVEIELTDKAVLLNGTDVTERTKDQDVSNTASIIAMFPKVRERLLVKQHQIATNALNNGKIVVAEGRDTGT